jgi:hypothetical protein
MKRFARIAVLAAIPLLGVLLIPSPKAGPATGPSGSGSFLKIAGLRAAGGQPRNDTEGQQLDSVFGPAATAGSSIPPGPDAGALRRAIDNELRAELEGFVTNNPASPWTPSVHLLLAHRAQLRCGYSPALNHYEAALSAVAGTSDPTAKAIAREAGAGLGRGLGLGDGNARLGQTTPGRILQVRPLLPRPAWPAHPTGPVPAQKHHRGSFLDQREAARGQSGS